MENDHKTLRGEWDRLSIQQLESMLQQELERDNPDDDSVLQLLHLLEEQKSCEPLHMGEKEKIAWKTYQSRMKSRTKKPGNIRRWIAVAASLVLVVGMLFTLLPQKAEAETFFEMLARWTSDFFQLFSSDADNNQSAEYLFVTDNPGLQELYDAVVKLGVTDPVVPMWLPDGSELVELKVVETPVQLGVQARFSIDALTMVFRVNLVDEVMARDFYREDQAPVEYERDGIIHNIMRNKEIWTVVWTRDRIECAIMMDCQEDTMYRILDSIYVMEGNQ